MYIVVITCYSFVKELEPSSTLTVKQVIIIYIKQSVNIIIQLGISTSDAELAVSNWKPTLWISIGTAAALLLLQVYRVGLFRNRPRSHNNNELENYIP